MLSQSSMSVSPVQNATTACQDIPSKIFNPYPVSKILPELCPP